MEKTIIRFAQVAHQKTTPIQVNNIEDDNSVERFIGFVEAKRLLPLFTKEILDANPRKPKTNSITMGIISGLSENPELFPYKSKGILIGTEHCQELDRNRFELIFKNTSAEGILDGGHNMLAIGLHIIKSFVADNELKKIKTWEGLLHHWHHVKDLDTEGLNNIQSELNFLVSVELIVPNRKAENTMQALEDFRAASIEICAARNNNAQLTSEAKTNQNGFYDDINNLFTENQPKIADRIEWKTNEWEDASQKHIAVRDIIAFAWLPLSILDAEGLLLPDKFNIQPNMLYSAKSRASKAFDKLMAHPDMCLKNATTGRYELHNPLLLSAFKILTDLPELFDLIMLNFPNAYNATGGKLGRLKAVKEVRGDVLTPYMQHKMQHKYRVPDGYVWPLFYSLTALMHINNGEVVWKTDPKLFIDNHLGELVKTLTAFMNAFAFDPQRISKDTGTYSTCKTVALSML